VPVACREAINTAYLNHKVHISPRVESPSAIPLHFGNDQKSKEESFATYSKYL